MVLNSIQCIKLSQRSRAIFDLNDISWFQTMLKYCMLGETIEIIWN